jgi:hypothetical protein
MAAMLSGQFSGVKRRTSSRARIICDCLRSGFSGHFRPLTVTDIDLAGIERDADE